MKTTRLKPFQCPHCGVTHDAVTSVDGHDPNRGDFSVCIECQDLVVFDLDEDGDMTLRPATEAELATIPLDVLARTQRHIREIKKRTSKASR